MARPRPTTWQIAFADRTGTIEYSYSQLSGRFVFARFNLDGERVATGEACKSFTEAQQSFNLVWR